MCAIIRKIVNQAHLTFKNQNVNHQYTPNMQKLLSLTDTLKANDVGLSEQGDALKTLPDYIRAPICHINIIESAHITVSIFIVRKGMKLPLHDHPGMTGIIKVLYGSLKITSYKAAKGCLSLAEHSSLSTIPVSKLPDVVLTPASGCQVLNPHQGNFHAVHSVDEDAAMFDILAPPYDETRECNFYREYPEEFAGKDNVFRLLQRITQPSSFYCDQLPYTGPSLEGIIDDDEEL